YNCNVLKIVIAPSPILSSIAKPVSRVDAAVTRIIEEMKKTLIDTTDPKGVGLAAPQVGKPLRIFIAKPTDNSKIMVFINPEIIERSSDLDYVRRPKKSNKASKKRPFRWSPFLKKSFGAKRNSLQIPQKHQRRR
ncbi:MAG: Peptide deformylase, partial [Candidatus Levybacteria bacterium GW2011_GWA1_37_16]